MIKLKIGDKVEILQCSCLTHNACEPNCIGSLGKVIETPKDYLNDPRYKNRNITVRFSLTSWCLFKRSELTILK